MRGSFPTLAAVVVSGAAGMWCVTPARGSDCDREIVIAPLRVCTLGDVTTFELEGGEPFHETTRTVDDVRVIAPDDSPVLAILWDEQDADGACRPHYAVTGDGLSVRRVYEVTYELGLRYARRDGPARPDEWHCRIGIHGG